VTRARCCAGLAALVAGCAFGGSPPQVREYDLLIRAEPRATTPPTAPALTLQLPPFEADPALDRDGLVWRRGEVEVGAYSQHRWARPPQDAVRDLLARALRELPGTTVATEPPLLDPDLVLVGHLARCEEVDRGERWWGVLELTVVLARRDGEELLRRTYAAEEPAPARNPPGVVVALRRAALRVADEVAEDVAGVMRLPAK
jgi:uncharacterized lipoprotein YmbA